MSLDQIRRFIVESTAARAPWETIRVLGGEPTLHPDLIQILELLLDYRETASPATCIAMITNGSGPYVKRVLEKIPAGVEVRNTEKEHGLAPFDAFNSAPADSPLYRYADYANACAIHSFCGMGLTPYGYYPCAVAGGIDRILGLDVGRKELPAPDDPMLEELRLLCRYCGHFGFARPTKRKKVSPFWRDAYARYRERKPHLTIY
jgi:hypothetical protein